MLMMKKIAILTINDDTNYGNRLQNYAVQKTLQKLNFSVETINNQKNIVGINIIKKKIKNIIKKLLNFKRFRRYNAFIKFNKNIKYSKIYIDSNHVPKDLKKKYDFFITGSDQVWNPSIGRLSDIDLLNFADNNQKISFSASFGISNIPESLKSRVKNNIETFKAISVREDAGKEIIAELTDRKDTEVLIDPTMMLDAKEWDNITKKPKMLKCKKYILKYFLGNLSETRKKEIERFAEENDCEIIDILDQNSPFYRTGPSEFLYLEKNAFLICTDSFHSCVFAILYNRPFIVFEREDKEEKMNSRIDTLLTKFNLSDRRFSGNLAKQSLNHDYMDAYKILYEEIKKAEKFLKKALN